MVEIHEGSIQRLALAVDQDGRWLLTALLVDGAAVRSAKSRAALRGAPRHQNR